MKIKRILGITPLLLATGGLALGTVACGSSDSSQEQGGPAMSEVTPAGNAPESAGDKIEGAPDDVISERPGGPGKPVSP